MNPMRLVTKLANFWRRFFGKPKPITISVTVIPPNPDWPIAWRKVAYEHFLPIEDWRGLPWTGCQGLSRDGERCGCCSRCKIVFKEDEEIVMVPVRE